MAKYFVDHGLYAACSFTADTVNANAVMTVTAVTSGRLAVGSVISAPSYPVGTTIVTLGTGRGGAGTYTVSVAATATSTGQSMTAVEGHGALDPAWGVAQDGDGKAKIAAVPAIGAVVFTQGHTSGSIGVFGVTVTPAASASATAAADNLATAINASATAVATGISPYLPQLRNLVFARGPAGGAPAGTCQIMTRAGSADLNDTGGNTTLTQASFNGTVPTLTQFAGGASGAWGTLYNTNGTSFPSLIARYTYGIWGSSVLTGPLVVDADVVHVRAAKDIPHYNMNGAVAFGLAPASTTDTMKFVIDNSVEWADGANPVLRFYSVTATPAGSLTFFPSTRAVDITASYDHAAGHYGLFLDGTGVTNNRGMVANGLGYTQINGVRVKGVGAFILTTFASANRAAEHTGLLLETNSATALVNSGATNSGANQTFNDFVFANTGGTVPHPGIYTRNQVGKQDVAFLNGAFKDFAVGSTLIGIQTTASSFKVSNCDMGGVTRVHAFSKATITGQSATSATGVTVYTAVANRANDGQYLIDTMYGLAEWNPLRVYPYLNARLPSNVGWSLRMHAGLSPQLVNARTPWRAPAFSKVNSLANGARTVTVEMCLRDTWSTDQSKLWIEVTYLDVNDKITTLSTRNAAGGSIPTSSLTWSQESGGQVIYDDGGILLFNKHRMTVTTPVGKNMKSGCEVDVTLVFAEAAANEQQMLFVDPDVGIA